MWVATEHVAVAQTARSRKGATIKYQVGPSEVERWLHGRYIRGALCRLFSHLRDTNRAITISIYACSYKSASRNSF